VPALPRLGVIVAVVAFGIGLGVASVASPALLADRYDLRAARPARAGAALGPVTGVSRGGR